MHTIISSYDNFTIMHVLIPFESHEYSMESNRTRKISQSALLKKIFPLI